MLRQPVTWTSRPRLLPLVGLLALSACGSATTSQSSSATPAPKPTGVPFTAESFSTTIPPGWQNMTQDPSTYSQTVRTDEGTGILVITHPVPGQFSNSVNDVAGNIVVLQLNTVVPADQLQTCAQQERRGAVNPTAPIAVAVDRSPGYQVAYGADIKGTPGMNEEVCVNRDGKTYDISLTTSKYAFADQEKDYQSLLQSWKWTR